MENNYKKTECCGNCKFIVEDGFGEYEDYWPEWFCELTSTKRSPETYLEFDQLGICDKFELREDK